MQNMIQKLIDFRNARGWEKYHTEAELARALTIEATEINRLYQWGQDADQERLEEEVADVMIYAIYLCEKRGIDPIKAIHDKIEKNAIKYPVFGSLQEEKWNAKA